MAGVSVSVDSEKQVAATTHVVESGDAITSSAQSTSSLGAAQQSMFWGSEDGPQALREKAALLFDAVSEFLAQEAGLIATFEAEINAALKDFTGTEQENKLQLENIQNAIDRVDKSEQAARTRASAYAFQQYIAVPGSPNPFFDRSWWSTSGSNSGGTPASGGSTTPPASGPRKF